MNRKLLCVILWTIFAHVPIVLAQAKVPPWDIWPEEVMTKIRDKTTLDLSLDQQFGSLEVTFTSNAEANFFDARDPYAEHTKEKIVIHGYLSYPLIAGPYPAVVLLHGRGGKADLGQAQLLSGLGVVAFAIDGPQAGKSTGGPTDNMQAWISVDKGAEYGYLYHYAYAAMRALTVLEALAEKEGNPYKIDATKLGAIGASSGAIVTTIMNAVDNRMKAAIAVASAGNWHHTLRYRDSWLYHDLYVNTRCTPYSGTCPSNSISDIDTDSTLVGFLSYFDPIRYASQQGAPVLTIIGTHDQYSPLPNANLNYLATASSGAQSNFVKRVWFVQNANYPNLGDSNLMSLSGSLRQWLEYCFGKRQAPLATPQISLVETTGGLRFETTLSESSARLAGMKIEFFAATRIDSSGVTPYTPIQGFTPYPVIRDGYRYVVSIGEGEKSASGEAYSAQNVIYFVTVTDPLGLPVSSLVYKGKSAIDLVTNFTPVFEHHPGDSALVPVPPDPPADAARSTVSAIPLSTSYYYHGMALANPTDTPIAVRIETRAADGRQTAVDGVASPAFMNVPARSEQIFVNSQVLGPGLLNGSVHIAWSDKRGTFLAFRGSDSPAMLDGIGPMSAPGKSLWVPLAPEQDGSYPRMLRLFSGSSTPATVTVTYRNRLGDSMEKGQVIVPPYGRTDLQVDVGSGTSQYAVVQIDSTAPISARVEVRPSRDAWSVEALPASTSGRFIQPHAEYNGTFKTRFIIMNTSTTAGKRTVKFKRHKQTGETIGNEVSIYLENGQTASLALETIFNVPSSEAAGSGWVEGNVEGGGLLIYALAYDPSKYAVAVSSLGSGDSGTLSMPYFVEKAGYWTGLAIANPGGSEASATIVAYGQKGEVLGQGTITVPAGQSKTQVVHQWISGMPEEATGQIIITTSTPLNLLAYFGGTDGGSIAAIPFTPIVP